MTSSLGNTGEGAVRERALARRAPQRRRRRAGRGGGGALRSGVGPDAWRRDDPTVTPFRGRVVAPPGPDARRVVAVRLFSASFPGSFEDPSRMVPGWAPRV